MFIAGLGAAYVLTPPSPKIAKEPSVGVVIATLIAAVAFIPLTYYVPILMPAVPAKPYNDFLAFYHGPYLKAHEVGLDQIVHVLIFGAMLYRMCSKPNHLVAWVWSLGIGALFTRLLIGYEMEYLEASVMAFVGVAISKHYGVMTSFLLHYVSWMLLDLFSHIFLGKNGDVAMFIGKHYLSWGLIAQESSSSTTTTTTTATPTPATTKTTATSKTSLF